MTAHAVLRRREPGRVHALILGVVPVVLGAGVPVLPQRIAGLLRLEDVEPVGGGFAALRYTLPGRGYTSDVSV